MEERLEVFSQNTSTILRKHAEDLCYTNVHNCLLLVNESRTVDLLKEEGNFRE